MALLCAHWIDLFFCLAGRALTFFPGLTSSLRVTEFPRAVTAFFLDVITLGQWRNLPCIPSQLSGALQNNLRAAVIQLDRPVDFNHLSLQLTHVPYVSEVGREHHYREGADPVVLAEIKKGDAPIAFLDPQHLAANTSSFTDVFFGFRNSDAIGDGNSREKKCYDQRWKGGRNTHKASL